MPNSRFIPSSHKSIKISNEAGAIYTKKFHINHLFHYSLYQIQKTSAFFSKKVCPLVDDILHVMAYPSLPKLILFSPF